MEVCYSIFTYLSQTDFFNLCLVHRNLRALAEPYLYANIQLSWNQRWGLKWEPHPITSLLRSVLRRPQLAAYVRGVSLVGINFHDFFANIGPLKILVSKTELDEVQAFVMNTTVVYRELWLEGLHDGLMDAFVAVLLSQPFRLRCLEIEGPFLCGSRFIGLVLRSMILERNAYNCGLQLDLRNLETVSLHAECHHSRFKYNARNTADLLPVFYLPSIKCLSATIDNPTTFTWPAIHPPSPSQLRHLNISNLREPSLRQILSVTNHLQSLHWRWYHFPRVYDEEFHAPILDLTQIIESISCVQEILIDLEISACNQNDPEPLPLTIRGSMKGLLEFKRLKKLTVPLIFLVGGWSVDLTKRIEDCLPRNLEFLAITHHLCTNDECEWWEDDNDMFTVLERWLESYQASTPYLCDVKVSVDPTDDNAAHAQRLSSLTDGAVRVWFPT